MDKKIEYYRPLFSCKGYGFLVSTCQAIGSPFMKLSTVIVAINVKLLKHKLALLQVVLIANESANEISD